VSEDTPFFHDTQKNNRKTARSNYSKTLVVFETGSRVFGSSPLTFGKMNPQALRQSKSLALRGGCVCLCESTLLCNVKAAVSFYIWLVVVRGFFLSFFTFL